MQSTLESGNNKGPMPPETANKNVSLIQESGNNQNPVPISDFIVDSPTKHERDPKYYYEDGSVVLQVGGVLFKGFDMGVIIGAQLQASLISKDLLSHTLRPNALINEATGTNNQPLSAAESSDESPFTLPAISASQFRNFLDVLLGVPYDPDYMMLITAAHEKRKHGRALLIRYLDIAYVARRLERTPLEEWAQLQIMLVLEPTELQVAFEDWDKESILFLSSYANSTRNTHFILSVTTFIQYFVSVSANTDISGQPAMPSNLNTCMELYKDPDLPKNNPALFGCIFVTILSLGPHSVSWSSGLSRSERAILYDAQTWLTSTSNQLDRVKWLQSSAASWPIMKKLCAECQRQLERLWWRLSIEYVNTSWDAASRDATALSRLPQYRQVIASSWNLSITCSALQTTVQSRPARSNSGLFATIFSALSSERSDAQSNRISTSETTCSNRVLALMYIDLQIQLLYEELASRHGEFLHA